MNNRPVRVAVFLAGLSRAAGAWGAETQPLEHPVPAARDTESFGLHVQRTMTLLATSTPQKRNKVRILFYGQSITEQDWSRQVADDLRRRFPHAELEVENRAIGGFASQLLVRPAEHDLYPFYPDLLIFHVYGGNNEYEEIIRNTRRRTTAEVLMQKDHVTRWPPEVIDKEKDKGAWWDDLMNRLLLPGIARKYGCGLVDVRGPWLEYLRANRLEPQALLKDGVHLNDQGNALMAALVGRYLVYRPELPSDGWRDTVRTLEVGKDVSWEGRKLVVEFEGNRVDAIAGETAGGSRAARVRVDGKAPSEFPGVYRISRPSPGPWSPLTVTRVDHDAPLVAEDWALKVTSVAADSAAWRFEVTGSRTGADGGGSSGETFVSRSGRVRIEPGSWFRHGPVPPGHSVTWTVLPMFVDRYEPPGVFDPARESVTTLAQGLTNVRHTLEVVADGVGAVPVRAIRVYRPPVK